MTCGITRNRPANSLEPNTENFPAISLAYKDNAPLFPTQACGETFLVVYGGLCVHVYPGMTGAVSSRAAENTGRSQRRPRTCNVCGQSFSKTEHLDRHIRSHTREKPYTCTVCSKSYGRQDTLQRHVRSHRHSGTSSSTPCEGGISVVGDDNVVANPPSATALSSHMLDVVDPFSSEFSLESLHWGRRSNLNGIPVETSDLPNGAAHSPSIADLHSLDVSSLESSWLLREDFDIQALDSSIAATIADWGRSSGTLSEICEPAIPPAVSSAHAAAQLNGIPLASSTTAAIQRTWFTKASPDGTAFNTTRRPSQQEVVDEEYRASLARRLQARISDETLPSADFLVR